MEQDSNAGLKKVLSSIVIALIMGVVTLTMMFGFMGQFDEPSQDPIMIGIGVGAAAMASAMSFVIPGIIASQTIKQQSNGSSEMSDRDLLAIYQTKTIIAYALLEGVALMNVILAHSYSLLVVGILVGIMLIRFPTSGRIDSWIRERKELDAFNR